MKRLKRSLKILACCMACCVAVIISCQDAVEAAVNPILCKHVNIGEGYSIVGHYDDTHVPCTKCGEVCTRCHEIVRKTTYCKDCYISCYQDEDVVRTHSSDICKNVLDHH